MYLIGAALLGLFGFLYFAMVDTAIPSLVFIAIVLSLIPHDMQYGPQGAFIAEAFTPRLRYSGSSLGYQFASIIDGGPAPIIATIKPVLRSRFTSPPAPSSVLWRPLSCPTTRARIYRRNMTTDDLSVPKTGSLCGGGFAADDPMIPIPHPYR
jgi:hypothetical protein